jgi:hypothetical protein
MDTESEKAGDEVGKLVQAEYNKQNSEENIIWIEKL